MAAAAGRGGAWATCTPRRRPRHAHRPRGGRRRWLGTQERGHAPGRQAPSGCEHPYAAANISTKAAGVSLRRRAFLCGCERSWGAASASGRAAAPAVPGLPLVALVRPGGAAPAAGAARAVAAEPARGRWRHPPPPHRISSAVRRSADEMHRGCVAVTSRSLPRRAGAGPEAVGDRGEGRVDAVDVRAAVAGVADHLPFPQ